MLQSRAEWIRKQDPYICCQQETYFILNNTTTEINGMKKVFHANKNIKQAMLAIVGQNRL